MKDGIVVGLDASRNRSGGAQTHVIGLLLGCDPRDHGIREVHVWAFESLMKKIPDFPWLIKHTPPALEKSLLHQVQWQYKELPREAERVGIDILFNTSAGTVCPYQPAVTLSQDMLPFEPGVPQLFGISKYRLRLLLLYFIQSRQLKRAHLAMFLTNYARDMIQKVGGPLKRTAVVPHGIGEEFRIPESKGVLPTDRPVRCLYVSNAMLYKNQWHVIRAIGKLRAEGRNVTLLLVGGGVGIAQRMVEETMAEVDPQGAFVTQLPFAKHGDIPGFLSEADIFLFASSCENLPITLLEGMAAGLPIASSDRGPMPEVLTDAGVYFNPQDEDSIATAVRHLIDEPDTALYSARRSRELAATYSWERCARSTWTVLHDAALSARSVRPGKRTSGAGQP